MNKDYLWDKTGEDAEIKELENSLKQFRSSNTAPPELPPKTLVIEDSKRPLFSFKFAFAALACVLIISVGILQVLDFGGEELAENSSEKITTEETKESPAIVRADTSNDATVEKQPLQPTFEKAKYIPKQKTKKRIKRAKKQANPKVKKANLAAKTAEPKTKTVKLTKEEKEAYEKLLEALAITGSQMRIVREKINGIEEAKTPTKDGR